MIIYSQQVLQVLVVLLLASPKHKKATVLRSKLGVWTEKVDCLHQNTAWLSCWREHFFVCLFEYERSNTDGQ